MLYYNKAMIILVDSKINDNIHNSLTAIRSITIAIARFVLETKPTNNSTAWSQTSWPGGQSYQTMCTIRQSTLDIWRAFSIMARNLSSDSSELAVLPGAIIFFSFNFATTVGSKSANTSLRKEILSIKNASK